MTSHRWSRARRPATRRNFQEGFISRQPLGRQARAVNRALPFCALLLLVPASAASALPDVWTRTGPPGGHVTALAVSPDVPGLSYAALEGGGVWRSTDGGVSFVETSNPQPGVTITALAFDRVDSGRLYAGSDGAMLYVSSDDGASFSEVAALNDGIRVILPDPSLDDRLYVATDNGGVFRSDDHGGTFLGIESLFPFDPVVHAMAIDPTDSNRLYFSTGFFIVWSDDAGATVNVADTSPASCAQLIIDPITPSTVYAASESFDGGVFVSTDSGVSWTSASSGLQNLSLTSLAMDPSDPAVLFAGTRGSGVWRSENGAASWAPASAGLADSRVGALAIAPSGDLVLGAEFGGVFVSSDGALSWERGGGGFNSSWVEALVASSNRVVASAKGNQVFASSDGGESWAFAGTGLPPSDVLSLAVDPTDATVMYAGTDGAGVFKSVDGLSTWGAAAEGVESASVTAIAVDPADSSFVLLGTRGSGETASVFASHDSGASWSAVTDSTTGWVTAIVFTEPGSIFVATEGQGLWKSTDKAATFAAANRGAGEYGVFLLSFAAHPASGVLYEGQHGGGLGVSLDGAGSWTVEDEGLPDWWLSGLAAHPSAPGQLFVATYFQGVVRSHDDGSTFEPYDDGLDNPNISTLALSPDAATLVAGTRGGGAYVVHPSESGTGGEGGSGVGGDAAGGNGAGGAPSTSTSTASGGAEAGGGGQDAEHPADDGCACTAVSAPRSSASSLLSALLLALAVWRGRRRPTTATAAA
jgi:hypothetical protein